jgi:hypothetical protein
MLITNKSVTVREWYTYLGIIVGIDSQQTQWPRYAWLLRECRGPSVVYTTVSSPAPFMLRYHHVRYVFFVSVLETGH